MAIDAGAQSAAEGWTWAYGARGPIAVVGDPQLVLNQELFAGPALLSGTAPGSTSGLLPLPTQHLIAFAVMYQAGLKSRR